MIFTRHAEYSSVLAARSEKMHRRERKSLDAELKVIHHLRSLSSVLQVWHGIRIPDPNRPRGAGEIDAVALTPWGIVALECKNWVGEVVIEDGDLVQLRRRARGKTPSVLPLLLKKVAHMKRLALSLYKDPALEVAHGVVLPNQASCFSQECKEHPSIVNLDGLEAFIKRAFTRHDLLSDAQLTQYAELIERCGGWDFIRFAGGRIDTGDFDDSSLPFGWRRSELKSVAIELHGGYLYTLFRGFRIKVTTTSWDGREETQIVNPGGMTLTHTVPWGPSGVDGAGTHPIAHLQSITFGSQISFTKAAAALAERPTVDQIDEGSTTLDESSANRSEVDSLRTLYERFQPGDAVTGVVLKHLKDDSGTPYALLIELVPRKVRGILHMRHLNDVNPVWFDIFYAPEKSVDVIIANNDYNGKIKLKIDKEA